MKVRRYIQAGQRFGKLLVVARTGKGGLWECLCDCGNTIFVTGSKLNQGQRACTCVSGKNRGTHFDATRGRQAPEYHTWTSMIGRCFNENNAAYGQYGGRGITVCDRWRHSYPAFLADMGRRPSLKHSIDRINNDGNYEPDNCYWATRSEQSRNRRTNIIVTIRGVSRCVIEWAEISGLPEKTLYYRAKRGWPASRILSPVRPLRRAAN